MVIQDFLEKEVFPMASVSRKVILFTLSCNLCADLFFNFPTHLLYYDFLHHIFFKCHS